MAKVAPRRFGVSLNPQKIHCTAFKENTVQLYNAKERIKRQIAVINKKDTQYLATKTNKGTCSRTRQLITKAAR